MLFSPNKQDIRLTMYRQYIWSVFLSPLILLLNGCDNDSAAREDANARSPGRPVITAPVRLQPQTTRLEAVGTSRAIASITLYPEVSGEVETLHFRAGDRVEAGAHLVQLEAQDERLAVDAAEVELKDAERLLSRYRRTHKAGAVTESTLEEAQSAVARAQITLARARVALANHRIQAPFAGHLGLTDIDPGAHIDPSTAIATLDDRSQLLVTFVLPEIFYDQIGPDTPVSISSWAHGSDPRPGRIMEIDSQIDPATRSFAVRAVLANDTDQLRPGMSFRVALELVRDEYPQVPETALQWGGDGAYAWRIDDGIARRVPASVVMREKGFVLLDADLPSGTRVVVEGLQGLREGAAVELIESETVAP